MRRRQVSAYEMRGKLVRGYGHTGHGGGCQNTLTGEHPKHQKNGTAARWERLRREQHSFGVCCGHTCESGVIVAIICGDLRLDMAKPRAVGRGEPKGGVDFG